MKWVFMVVVIGALYMVKTKTTRHVGNSKKQLSANSRELAKHNTDRYNNLSPIGKLYENITNIPWSNSGSVDMSRVEENKLRLKHQKSLNASTTKQEL